MNTTTAAKHVTSNDVQKTTKSDYYRVDPKNIVIEKGFNERTTENYGNIPELAMNMVQLGQLVPCIAFKNKGEDSYTLTSGHRRVKAINYAIEANKAGKEGFEDLSKLQGANGQVSVKVTVGSEKVVDRLLIMLTTDTEQRQFTPLEKASLFKRLEDVLTDTNGEHRLSKKDAVAFICRKMGGISQAAYYNTISLNSLPKEIKDLIAENKVSAPLVVELKRDFKDDKELVSAVESAVRQSEENARANGGKAKKVTASQVVGKKPKTLREKLQAIYDELEGETNVRAKAFCECFEGLASGDVSIKKLADLFK